MKQENKLSKLPKELNQYVTSFLDTKSMLMFTQSSKENFSYNKEPRNALVKFNKLFDEKYLGENIYMITNLIKFVGDPVTQMEQDTDILENLFHIITSEYETGYKPLSIFIIILATLIEKIKIIQNVTNIISFELMQTSYELMKKQKEIISYDFQLLYYQSVLTLLEILFDKDEQEAIFFKNTNSAMSDLVDLGAATSNKATLNKYFQTTFFPTLQQRDTIDQKLEYRNKIIEEIIGLAVKKHFDAYNYIQEIRDKYTEYFSSHKAILLILDTRYQNMATMKPST